MTGTGFLSRNVNAARQVWTWRIVHWKYRNKGWQNIFCRHLPNSSEPDTTKIVFGLISGAITFFPTSQRWHGVTCSIRGLQSSHHQLSSKGSSPGLFFLLFESPGELNHHSITKRISSLYSPNFHYFLALAVSARNVYFLILVQSLSSGRIAQRVHQITKASSQP